MATSLLYMYTESPLHAGTGSTTSVIDLPIQRERTTNYPHVYGSGVKGALRSQSNLTPHEANIVFGYDEMQNRTDKDENEKTADKKDRIAYAGAVSVGEAKLVLFPVRSLTGIFAYVTCPFVLARFKRDLSFAGIEKLPPVIDDLQASSTCAIAAVAKNDGGVARSGAVVLEEYTFNFEEDENIQNQVFELAEWLSQNAMPEGSEYDYWREMLPKRLVIIPDDAFRDFVMYSTQIVTRIRIQKDTKTVQDGALWTQESLPADVLLVSTIVAHDIEIKKLDIKKDAMQVGQMLVDSFPGKRIQIGGDETTGHGMVALNWQ